MCSQARRAVALHHIRLKWLGDEVKRTLAHAFDANSTVANAVRRTTASAGSISLARARISRPSPSRHLLVGDDSVEAIGCEMSCGLRNA